MESNGELIDVDKEIEIKNENENDKIIWNDNAIENKNEFVKDQVSLLLEQIVTVFIPSTKVELFEGCRFKEGKEIMNDRFITAGVDNIWLDLNRKKHPEDKLTLSVNVSIGNLEIVDSRKFKNDCGLFSHFEDVPFSSIRSKILRFDWKNILEAEFIQDSVLEENLVNDGKSSKCGKHAITLSLQQNTERFSKDLPHHPEHSVWMITTSLLKPNIYLNPWYIFGLLKYIEKHAISFMNTLEELNELITTKDTDLNSKNEKIIVPTPLLPLLPSSFNISVDIVQGIISILDIASVNKLELYQSFSRSGSLKNSITSQTPKPIQMFVVIKGSFAIGLLICPPSNSDLRNKHEIILKDLNINSKIFESLKKISNKYIKQLSEAGVNGMSLPSSRGGVCVDKK
jgi:hypothetical protein